MTAPPVLNAEQIARILEKSFASARGTTNEQLVALEASLREALAETDRRVDDLPEHIKTDVKEYLSTLEKAYREAFSKWVSWREDFQRSATAHFERFQQELADLLAEQQRLAASVHNDGIAFGKDVAALRENLETTFNQNQHRFDALSLGADSNGQDIQDLNKQVEALIEERLALTTSLSQSLEDINAGLDACGTRDAKIDGELTALDADFKAAITEWEDLAEIVVNMQTTSEARFEEFHEHRQNVVARIEGFAQTQESDRKGIDRSRARLDEHVSILADLQAKHMDFVSRVDGVSEYIAKQNEDFQQRIENRVRDIAATLAHSIATVRDWQGDGPPYWANSVVRYRGGIWIATRETTGTPGESPDWNLLFEGIDWVDMHADGARVALNLRTSSGAETEFGMDLPSFAFHGTWSADKVYKARDTVMHDGHRWVALRDDPQGEPSESEHWRLFAMRGPRGRKGDRGPPGETPSTKDFILAWRAHLDVADGTPVMRFRGAWSFEKSFMVGDVVSYEKSLYIAVTDREASFDPPTVTQDSGWAMFAPYRTVGAGAPVREVEGQTGF